MDESLRMRGDEDCRTAGFGKTERPVGWEGNGEPIMMKLVRHCEGKPAATDRLHLQSLSHSFTLDLGALWRLYLARQAENFEHHGWYLFKRRDSAERFATSS